MLFVKVGGRYKEATNKQVLKEVEAVYENSYIGTNPLTSPDLTRGYLRSSLTGLEHEVFVVVFLNNQNQVITSKHLFRGTIDASSVYPREVVKEALAQNAKAVIFAHNHPSGLAEPSEADKHITERLKQALSLLDIKVLDHLIVGKSIYSFAEHGLI